MTVFDSDCASVYVEKENDVAYVPYGLDLLTKLAAACNRVGNAIRAEHARLAASSVQFPDQLLGETRVGEAIRKLKAPGSEERVDKLSTLSETERQRLAELRVRISQFMADDPDKRSAEFRLRAQRVESLADRISQADRRLSTTAAEKLKEGAEKAAQAEEAARLASDLAFGSEPIRNVGSDTWRALWEAAREYSETEAFLGKAFPVVERGSRCVLCQQALSREAAERLMRFEDFVQEGAQVAADRASAELTRSRANLRDIVVIEPGDDNLLAEVEMEDAAVAKEARTYLARMEDKKSQLDDACDSGNWEEVQELFKSPVTRLRSIAKALHGEATDFEKAKIPEERQQLERELAELEARDLLEKMKGQVKAEARRQRLKACCLRS